MAKVLYCIPGLGTDYRIYSEIIPKLNWSGEIQYLDFIAPMSNKESVAEYTLRLRQALPESWDETPIIMGMSLGGMIAQELAKLIPYDKLILISTVKTDEEQPFKLKIWRKLPLHQLLPGNLTKKYGKFLAKKLNLVEEKYLDLIFEMFRAHSDEHFIWGRNAALQWQGVAEILPKTVHLHGTKDHIFPSKNIKQATFIEKGTHNLILERAEEVAKWVNAQIANF